MSASLHNDAASMHVRRVSLTSTVSVYSVTTPSMSRTTSEQEQYLDTPDDEYPFSVSFEGKRFAHDLEEEGRSAIFVPLDRPSPLQNRRSTRELISKYEAISDPHKTPPSRQSPHTAAPSPQRRNSPLPELPFASKPKSQTPFSFRNLLTVFGKKNKSPKATGSGSSQTDDVFIGASPISRTGPALYLSSSTQPPAWRTCSLTLHPSHLALTFSEDARRITHTIPLLYCIDVASLASHQLGRQVPAPSMGGDAESDKVAHVFEMTFEGWEPTKERLAAWSVAERGRWVSATWDAILACRDPSLVRNDFLTATSNYTIRGSPLKVVNGSSQPSSSTSSPTLATSRPLGREHTDVCDPLISTATASVPSTPTRPPRPGPPVETSSPPPSLPSSSSIQALGSMTLVRQRLATLDTQSQTPYRQSLVRGFSNSGNYVSSSMGRPTRKTDSLERENNAQTLKPSHRLERTRPPVTISGDDGKSLDTSFTALDAHAMYHEQPVESVGVNSTIHRENDAAFNGSPHISQDTLMKDEQVRPSIRPTEGVEGLQQNTHSLMTSFHEHAAEESSQASSLATRLASLGDGVDTIIANLKALPRGRDQADMVLVLTKLDQIKKEIAVQSCGTSTPITLGNESASSRASSSPVDVSPILTKLEELQGGLKGNLPLILRKLETLEAPSAVSADMGPVLNKLDDMMEAINVPAETRASPAALMEIHEKLDGLVALCSSLADKSKHPARIPQDELVMHNVSRSDDLGGAIETELEGDKTDDQANDTRPVRNSIAVPEQVARLLELLQDDQINRETQAKQQADSVRYLNELNTWLETFVANSAGNMRQVTTGIDQMCKEWLPVAEEQVDTHSSDETAVPRSPRNTFASLKHFLADQREKSDDTRNLQAAIQGLTETLKEDMAKNAEARSEMVQHAQIQKNSLNGLATELTKEIRGERLRFVDAMKDATSVNVAVHVEEFKKVLSRLHHEKMVLEQQIAELFSFAARQKHDQLPQPHPGSVNLEVPRAQPRPLPQINPQKLLPVHVVGDTSSELISL